ncbi:NfeD family protein [Nodosilinea sp. LEGE 06152]|uniref:NfeD family protein n=1 Tax=Nodosilinea sp. LEGE 06152 TaxID=2777966 RepID=UPI001881567B|nr:NfeD family protein [Nodosilinea sp. LEGE 06152]MBE9159115.1 NfeD family protein [Nodosilinea sp. LEGE 06152]
MSISTPLSAVLERKFYPGVGVIHSVAQPGLKWVVRVNGVYWTARAALSSYSFQAGDTIRPIDRQGNTLLIEPA